MEKKELDENFLLKKALLHKNLLYNKLYLYSTYFESLDCVTIKIASPTEIKLWAEKEVNKKIIGEVKTCPPKKKELKKKV